MNGERKKNTKIYFRSHFIWHFSDFFYLYPRWYRKLVLIFGFIEKKGMLFFLYFYTKFLPFSKKIFTFSTTKIMGIKRYFLKKKWRCFSIFSQKIFLLIPQKNNGFSIKFAKKGLKKWTFFLNPHEQKRHFSCIFS